MTLYKLYRLRCNGCGILHGFGKETAKDARAAARKQGWKRLPGSTSVGSDYCPGCARGRVGLR